MKLHLKYIITFIIFILGFFQNQGQNLLIRLFNEQQISSAKIKIELGKYVLIAENDTLETLIKGNTLEIKAINGKVSITCKDRTLGNYKSVKIQSLGFKNIFGITPNGAEKRTYDDNLIIKANSNFLNTINDVNLENYIAGVVQSEIYGKPECTDIFKVQSIISRTYALKNINKHQSEGFNLCDGVHCQAYKNRCLKPEVLTGALESKGEIIVDSTTGQLIDAAFHSNSGGQTANSEDVWVKPISYLRSKPDTFSVSMKNACWEKTFTCDEWLKYFSKKHKLNTNDEEIKDELLNFSQEERKAAICTIPLKTVRSDLKLRSTYFSVIHENDTVKLMGKGYGHGVGLSQEGAIRMVELGYNYKDVLLYYYDGAKVLQVDEEKKVEQETTINETKKNEE